MEYMEHGSLYDLLHNETMVLEGSQALLMMRDVSQGLRFLHCFEPPIIHCDMKAANILVDSKFRAKVADFGLAQRTLKLGGTGTPFWMAPELLRGEGKNSPQTDVYSFGIILYETWARREPYAEDDLRTSQILRLVANPKVAKRPPTPNNAPPQVQSLMQDCLVNNADARPSLDEIDTRLKRVDLQELKLEEAKQAARAREDKSSISLFDIFPQHIAEALKEGRTVEAEHKECVTIFFSDIIGFTTLSSTMEPRKVADMITRLYGKLDSLSAKHDIFKVETVGDAYMAVTNLVKPQDEDHVARIAAFARDAVKAANTTMIDTEDPSKGFVDIRVGFHSGPVVADVVGNTNPRYCLFGDTVNTASRMESSSKRNRIHCSSTSAELLMDQAPNCHLQSRGMITIKGKGDMHTYWLEDMDQDLVSGRPSGDVCMVSMDDDSTRYVEMPVNNTSHDSPVPSGITVGTANTEDDLESG